VPTYQYVCESCDDQFEVVQSFTDPTLATHDGDDGCGGAVRKRFGAVGVVFKGSGFYRTDSRPKNGEGGDGAPAKEAKETGKDGAKGDTTAATKDTGRGAKDGAATPAPKADAPAAGKTAAAAKGSASTAA